MPVLVDDHGIDIAYSCTQKGLSCPPGLAPLTVTPRAIERLRARKTPVQSWYLDLLLLDGFYSGHKYHHTASATLFCTIRTRLTSKRTGMDSSWCAKRRDRVAAPRLRR